jgi:hypothetical protein
MPSERMVNQREALKNELASDMKAFLASQANANPRLRRLRAQQADVQTSITNPALAMQARAQENSDKSILPGSGGGGRQGLVKSNADSVSARNENTQRMDDRSFNNSPPRQSNMDSGSNQYGSGPYPPDSYGAGWSR